MKRREQENVVDQAEWKQIPKARDALLAPMGCQPGAEALLVFLSVSKDQTLCSKAHCINFAFPAAAPSGPLGRDFTPFVPISLHYLKYSSSPANQTT